MDERPFCTLSDVTRVGRALRRIGDAELRLGAAATAALDIIYRDLGARPDDGAPAVLARLFATLPYAELAPEQQAIARAATPHIEGAMRCLVLLATRGDEPAWNDVRASVGHRAIPLADAASVRAAPMIAALLAQFGVAPELVVSPPSSPLLDASLRRYNVFFVQEAAGSSFVPAQDFVTRHRVRSVVGFGGLMPSGTLYAAILFLRVSAQREAADLLQRLALDLKLALLPSDSDGERARDVR